MTCIFCQRVESHAESPEPDFIWSFRHSIAYLGRWQFYHGYTVLVAREHATELNQLTDRVRREFFDEMCSVARAIEASFHPAKLNYEMLGNQVPHLHWHVFPRYGNDNHARLPVWLDAVAAESDPELCKRLETGPLDRSVTIEKIRAALES